MANNTITVSIKCSICGKKHDIEITKEQYEDYRHSNKLIQEIFPDMKPEIRELFISQVCPDCWNKLFGKKK